MPFYRLYSLLAESDWDLPECLPVAEPGCLADLRIKRGIHGGAQAFQAFEFIDPQARRDVMLSGKLQRQTPSDADITVVVDDFTKNVPALFHGAD